MSMRVIGHLADGAADAAPTAPHATPRVLDAGSKKPRRNGPERFWDPRRVRVALTVALGLSFAAHYVVSPFNLVPGNFEIRDQDGEATLPIELLDDQAPPDEPPPPEPQAQGEHGADQDPNAPAVRDAGSLRTGTLGDAAPDGASNFKGEDGGQDGGIVDAGPPDATPVDPVLLAEQVKSGDPLVLLVINMDVIKVHAIANNLGQDKW